MKAVAAALRRQPVRAYLYGVLIPGEALAVSYGLLSANDGALWLALGAAVLVVPGIEIARAKVTPVADPRDKAGERLWRFSELPPRRARPTRHAAAVRLPLSRPPGQ